MSSPPIELEHVWKRYLLGQGGGASGALRRMLGRDGQREAYYAVRDLSLTVEAGESVGLIGRNGAGKSTVLKLLAGISRPTHGRATTRGRLASLINVGAGFHPELTGRENVLLNGVILGLSQREAAARYDAIVAFADLGPFMDTPVKFYSTGMYARLGFAVAAHVDPDVLLVDEVLSVGDAWFQDRSLRRMLAFRDAGTAVVFVSHNLAAVELMCQCCVWLDRGAVRAIGPTADVVRAYLDTLDDADAELAAEGAWLTVSRVDVLRADDRPTDWLSGAEPFTVRVVGQAARELIGPVFVVSVRGDHGPLFAGNMHIDGNWPDALPAGPFELRCQFDAFELAPGEYRVEVKVKQNVRTNYYEPRVLARFSVPGMAADAGAAVAATWRVEREHTLDGTGARVAARVDQMPSLAATEP
jgi:ABC-type polysaccharide/polyol phosphate transport system ATPase subunit